MNSDPDYQAASQGIRNPQQVILQPGMWLCRFAGSKGPDGKISDPGVLHQSPWWMSSDDFRKLLFATQKSNFNYKFFARIWLAVKSEWSGMDKLIIAKVKNRMAVWAGRGRTMREAMPNGMEFIYKPPADLTQLYIPGMALKKGEANSGYNLGNLVIESVNDVPPIGVKGLDGK